DAPCGCGRIALALAQRGVEVLGVDQAADLVAEAERRRSGLPPMRLRYERHDLRSPLQESGFDAAFNICNSIGYGTEAEDLAILSTLREAVRPGGLVFVEVDHRDAVVVDFSRNQRRADRLPDGTLLLEESRLDPVTGRVETTWYWSGPAGSGQRNGSFRVYATTELIRLMETAGLRLRSVHNGCSSEPFVTPGSP